MTDIVTSTNAIQPRHGKSRNYGKHDVFDGEYSQSINKKYYKKLAQFIFSVDGRAVTGLTEYLVQTIHEERNVCHPMHLRPESLYL